MNKNKKFTRGPWKAHGTQHQDWVETEWKGKKGPDYPPEAVHICKCGRDNGFYDAQLISQSPAMYQALEDDAEYLRRAAKWLKGMIGNMAIVSEMLQRAKEIDALLAKARCEEGMVHHEVSEERKSGN